MKRRNLFFILFLIGLMAPVSFSSDGPGELTTLYSSWDASSRGNMFDIEPLVDITEITGFDLNLGSSLGHVGEYFEVDVWYRMDTCVGHDKDPAGWILLGSGGANAEGIGLPTFLDLAGNGVSFAAGGTYGIYIDVTNYEVGNREIWYTSGGTLLTYANADLSAILYYGKKDPAFYGNTYYPRAWNGTIYYWTGPGTLTVFPSEISAQEGGTVDFHLNADAACANKDYFLLGSLSGSAPGLALPGGSNLPLNWDMFSDFVLVYTNGANLINFAHTLDINGQASAQLDTLGRIDPSLVGAVMTYAYVTVDVWPWFASNPVDVYIVP